MPTKTGFFEIKKEAIKPFTAIWISHMLVEIFLLMHPALVPVFEREFGLSDFQAGLLIAVPSLCRLIIVIPIGILADRYGPRRFIILSLLIGGLSAALLSQSSNAFILLILLCLVMISVTLYHPPGLSIISRLFPNQTERSTAIGLHGASGCIGQALGTISLGLLLVQFGWRFCYLLFAAPLLAWMFILARIRIPQFANQSNEPEKQVIDKPKSASKTALMSSGFVFLLISMGLNALANGGVSTFMTTYMTRAENLSMETASIIFGAGPLIGIVGSIAAGYVSSRLGDKLALTLIYFGQVIFLLGTIASPSMYLATFSFLMYEMFLWALWTPSTSMVASLMGKTSGGMAYSLFYFSHDTLGAISSIAAAILIENLGLISPFIFAIILLTASAFLVRLIKIH